MHSVQPSKSKTNRDEKQSAAQKSAAKGSTKRTTSINQASLEEIRQFFNDAELKLEEFGAHVEQAMKKMEKGSEKKSQQTQAWIRDQRKNIKAGERKIEQLFDTARVKAHLGAMDATEAAEEILQRVDRLKSRIDNLTAKASTSTADGLKKLSDVCLQLRSKLTH
jgi:hypothetical protein